MRNKFPLKKNNLAEWLAMKRWNELPVFRLRPPLQHAAEIPSTLAAAVDFRETRRRLDSGTLEIHFVQSTRTFADSPMRATLADVVSTEDDGRSITSTRSVDSEVILSEWRTTISEFNIPVIGLGGRVIVRKRSGDEPDQPASLVADVVVRERMARVQSAWRDPDAILQGLLQQIRAVAVEPVEFVQAEFGYLELSKYETQSWMRPAALISFAALAADGRPKWTATIAEPTTDTKEVDLAEGMGNWSN